MSFRLSDVNGIHHYAAFKPFLAAIPKSNRTRDAVEDAAVDFMRKYEAKYGMPMTPTIFEAFCHNIMTEIFQHKLWPVAAKKTAAKSMATIEDLQAKYDTMMTVSWGDDKYMPQAELDSDNEYIYDQPTQMVATANPWAVSEADALNGFTVPDLTLRKGIWESFPVILKPVDDCDGTARYAIEWHWDRLDASFMAEGASRNLDAMEWEDILRMRLFHSLATYSNKYTVEAARDDQQICVIAMACVRQLLLLLLLLRRRLSLRLRRSAMVFVVRWTSSRWPLSPGTATVPSTRSSSTTRSVRSWA
jgi:hypothetical protein